MTVAVLTGHKYNKIAVSLVKELRKAGIDCFAVICMDYKSLVRGLMEKIRRRELKKYMAERAGESLTALSKALGFRAFFSAGVNSAKTRHILESEKADIGIQCGVGIIRKQSLNMAKRGILNAHMALLPKYRGMNVLEWSLFYGDPLGVSIHLIDQGVDTGDVLLQGGIDIEKGDTIESLRHKAEALSINLLVKTIKMLEQGPVGRTSQDKEEGKQYFLMHPRLKEFVELKRLSALGSR